MLRGGWEFQEGTAVGFLLVWCGRSATTLVAAGHNLNKLWGKNELVFDLKISKFNSELEGVEENSVSPDMDVRLAFGVQDVPSEALAFSNKSEAE
jgi:hypothetical protein